MKENCSLIIAFMDIFKVEIIDSSKDTNKNDMLK